MVHDGRRVSAIDVLELIRADAGKLACLRAVRVAGLRGCWIAAGFVRNAVWDAMYGVVTHRDDEDIDVVYFDADETSEVAEKEFEARLRAALPAPWSVKNQARMHRARSNRFAPFTSVLDGMAHWVETSAPVGVRLSEGDELSLVAVHGLGDLLSGVLRPTPAFANEAGLAVFDRRVASKGWLERWPALRIDRHG